MIASTKAGFFSVTIGYINSEFSNTHFKAYSIVIHHGIHKIFLLKYKGASRK